MQADIASNGLPSTRAPVPEEEAALAEQRQSRRERDEAKRLEKQAETSARIRREDRRCDRACQAQHGDPVDPSSDS